MWIKQCQETPVSGNGSSIPPVYGDLNGVWFMTLFYPFLHRPGFPTILHQLERGAKPESSFFLWHGLKKVGWNPMIPFPFISNTPHETREIILDVEMKPHIWDRDMLVFNLRLILGDKIRCRWWCYKRFPTSYIHMCQVTSLTGWIVARNQNQFTCQLWHPQEIEHE